MAIKEQDLNKNKKHDEIIKSMHKYIIMRNTWNYIDLVLIKPRLLQIMAEMVMWCASEGLPMEITRIIDGRLSVSISDTHSEGRAFDMANTHGWTEKLRVEFTKHFNDLYGQKYGTSAKVSDKPKVVVYNTHGTGPHFHIQVRRFL